MKIRHIKGQLRRKFDHFLRSIDDDDIKDLLEKRTFISGGCITSMLMDKPINDLDIYFTNHEACVKVLGYYVKKFKERFNDSEILKEKQIWIKAPDSERVSIYVKSAGMITADNEEEYQYFENQSPMELIRFIQGLMKERKDQEKASNYQPVFLTQNAVSLSNGVQLICRFIGSPEQVHTFFDYVHCTCYWVPGTGHLELPNAAMVSILTKELKYVGSKYPIASLFRMRKFIHRGFSITAGQILKIAFQTNDLNLKDIKVLQDQLMGVDTAYFLELLEKLKDKEGDIDTAYICTMIDEVLDASVVDGGGFMEDSDSAPENT